MIVSEKYGFIFIHIPRTAGTYISKQICKFLDVKRWREFIGEPRALINREGNSLGNPYSGEYEEFESSKHITAKRLRNRIGKRKWSSYFKFAFVRNPWDRAISVYLHSIKSLNIPINVNWIKNKYLFNMSLITKYDILGAKSVQQADYICGDNDNLIVDFVGRFENLQIDFNKVCNEIEVRCEMGEKYDPTKRRDYKDWYTDKSKRIIRRVKSRDIEMFDYKY